MLPKRKRFFFHYFKQRNCMSVHFDKKCTQVDDVICFVPTETKWNKAQPHLVLRGFAHSVDIVQEDNHVVAHIR